MIMKKQAARVQPLVDVRQNFPKIKVDYNDIYQFYKGKIFQNTR